jgi:hypothetical protein
VLGFEPQELQEEKFERLPGNPWISFSSGRCYGAGTPRIKLGFEDAAGLGDATSHSGRGASQHIEEGSKPAIPDSLGSFPSACQTINVEVEKDDQRRGRSGRSRKKRTISVEVEGAPRRHLADAPLDRIRCSGAWRHWPQRRHRVGVSAISAKSAGNYDGAGVCDTGTRDAVYQSSNISTASFVAGGVLLAAGVVMVHSSPTHPTVAAAGKPYSAAGNKHCRSTPAPAAAACRSRPLRTSIDRRAFRRHRS